MVSGVAAVISPAMAPSCLGLGGRNNIVDQFIYPLYKPVYRATPALKCDQRHPGNLSPKYRQPNIDKHLEWFENAWFNIG